MREMSYYWKLAVHSSSLRSTLISHAKIGRRILLHVLDFDTMLEARFPSCERRYGKPERCRATEGCCMLVLRPLPGFVRCFTELLTTNQAPPILLRRPLRRHLRQNWTILCRTRDGFSNCLFLASRAALDCSLVNAARALMLHVPTSRGVVRARNHDLTSEAHATIVIFAYHGHQESSRLRLFVQTWVIPSRLQNFNAICLDVSQPPERRGLFGGNEIPTIDRASILRPTAHADGARHYKAATYPYSLVFHHRFASSPSLHCFSK